MQGALYAPRSAFINKACATSVHTFARNRPIHRDAKFASVMTLLRAASTTRRSMSRSNSPPSTRRPLLGGVSASESKNGRRRGLGATAHVIAWCCRWVSILSNVLTATRCSLRCDTWHAPTAHRAPGTTLGTRRARGVLDTRHSGAQRDMFTWRTTKRPAASAFCAFCAFCAAALSFAGWWHASPSPRHETPVALPAEQSLLHLKLAVRAEL